MTGQIFKQERELCEWRSVYSFRKDIEIKMRVILRPPSIFEILYRLREPIFYRCDFCRVWAWNRVVQTKRTKTTVGKSYMVESYDGYQCPDCGESWHNFYKEGSEETNE